MQIGLLLMSFLLPFVLMVVVTTVVASVVRRSPATSAWKATRDGVLFVVGTRRFQRVIIRTVGIAAIVVGCFLDLVAFSTADEGPMLAGAAILIGGFLFLWLAHGMTRLRLEVTPDTVWVFRMAGAPRQVSLNEVTELTALKSNNYGGIVARSAHKSLFYATRIMLGYPQLIDYLRTRRPDLAIPELSQPY